MKVLCPICELNMAKVPMLNQAMKGNRNVINYLAHIRRGRINRVISLTEKDTTIIRQ